MGCNSIEIVHNTKYCMSDSELYSEECIARTEQQKVKIVSVKICAENTIK